MADAATETRAGRTYVRYGPEVERVAPGEDDAVAGVIASMSAQLDRASKKAGRTVRPSHAKSHGLLKGELRVLPALPPELAQGLFGGARTYPVVARLANVPGEVVEDSVQTQRGLAVKVLGVSGSMAAGHEGGTTQDFVLDTGTTFPNATVFDFLPTIAGINRTTPLPDAAKAGVAAASRAANAALNAVGLSSSALAFFGNPPRHPLAEAYFTQAAIRYGDHVAKLGVFPVLPEMTALPDLDLGSDPDALRTATAAYFRERGAEFEVRVQLCTDLDAMPVEDASVEWDEDSSPYRPVARVAFPAQDAYSLRRRAYVDDALSFGPHHALEAHRGLGSIMRARLRTYPAIAAARHARSGVAEIEPRSLDDIPD